jgi:hypothetical protein
MNKAVLLVPALAFSLHAHASPALHGTWSAAIDGQPLVVVFEGNGTGKVNGKPMQWQALGPLLFVQVQGEQAVSYSYEVKGGKLNVAGGDLAGVVALSKGTAPAEAAAKQAKAAQPAKASAKASAGGAQELVGKWCKVSTFTANSGGSSRSTCFELKADGSYTYQHEGSMSAQTGSMASQSFDAGRWKVSGSQLVAQSQRGTVNTYALEKRNHPKNKRDPMICLDGECYVTFYNKPPW